MSEPQLRVVIDSNALIADPWMEGTQFGTLLDGLRQIRGRLVVPEVVFDEVVNKYQERYADAHSRVAAGVAEFIRLSRQDIRLPIHLDPDAAAKRYREWLKKKLDDIGAEVPPYPEIPHKEVAKRELQRKRPFSKGRGYRDYLIWHTVLAVDGQVVLVSEDSDFREGDDLHPDLDHDLRMTPHLRDSFSLSRGLRDFNDRFVLPQLHQLEELRQKLLAGGVEGVDLVAWLRENLDDFLVDDDLLVAGMGLPPGAGSAYLPKLTAAPTISIESVWEREPGKALVKARAVLPVIFNVSVDSDDFARHREVREIIKYLPDGSEASWREENTFEVDFVFTLGGEPPNVLDWDIEQVDARFC